MDLLELFKVTALTYKVSYQSYKASVLPHAVVQVENMHNKTAC